MLIEISGDRFVNPLSVNIIGIFPLEKNKYDDINSYVLHIGCPDGIDSQRITKEDRDLLLKAMKE